MSSTGRRKVQIIREYENVQEPEPEPVPMMQSKMTRTISTGQSHQPKQPVRIQVQKEYDKPRRQEVAHVTSTDGHKASFGDMQTKLEEEIEKKRLDWEKEVIKMQQEFFKMPTGEPLGGSANGNSAVSVKSTHTPSATGSEILDISSSKNLFSYKPDGSRVYQLRFNVKDFAPQEIHVKAEGSKLNVSAKHEEEKESGQKSSKNFNRQMDIPVGVDIEQLVAELSSDGILSVEAPVNEEQMEKSKQIDLPCNIGGLGNFDQIESYTVGDPFAAVRDHVPGFTPIQNVNADSALAASMASSMASSAFGQPEHGFCSSYEHSHAFPGHTCHGSSRPKMQHKGIGHSSPHIERVTDDAKKLRLEVHVGTDYVADEVTVELDGHHIHVKAKHEEKTSTGRTARREYSRSFEVNDKLDASSLKAVLDPEGGLFIGASLASNRDRNAAMQSIRNDMPWSGKPVNVVV